MTRAKKVKQERRAQATPPPRPPRRRAGWLLPVAGVVAAILAGVLFWQTSRDREVAASEDGPVHVHGLGIDPADGVLFIATHAGLFRIGTGEDKAIRVGDRHQDTMGFTIVGPHRFLGSGHPDLQEMRDEGLPSRLGLIESTDAGASWQPISLSGEADFHVLRSAGQRVYGYDASNDRLLESADSGRTWRQLGQPGSIFDVAPDPSDSQRLVAVAGSEAEQGLYESRDAGRSWSRLGEQIALLAWPTPTRLYLLDGNGFVSRSPDGGRTFEPRGQLGGQPAALLAHGPEELYAALHDGTIKRSTDGGATWVTRSTP